MALFQLQINPLSASPTKWSNTLKQFVGNLSMNCLSLFDHFVKLALKGLRCVVEAMVSKVSIFKIVPFNIITSSFFGFKKFKFSPFYSFC